MKKIYVGNLPWSASEAEVRDFFAAYGEVHSVAVITDLGRSPARASLTATRNRARTC